MNCVGYKVGYKEHAIIVAEIERFHLNYVGYKKTLDKIHFLWYNTIQYG